VMAAGGSGASPRTLRGVRALRRGVSRAGGCRLKPWHGSSSGVTESCLPLVRSPGDRFQVLSSHRALAGATSRHTGLRNTQHYSTRRVCHARSLPAPVQQHGAGYPAQHGLTRSFSSRPAAAGGSACLPASSCGNAAPKRAARVPQRRQAAGRVSPVPLTSSLGSFGSITCTKLLTLRCRSPAPAPWRTCQWLERQLCIN